MNAAEDGRDISMKKGSIGSTRDFRNSIGLFHTGGADGNSCCHSLRKASFVLGDVALFSDANLK